MPRHTRARNVLLDSPVRMEAIVRLPDAAATRAWNSHPVQAAGQVPQSHLIDPVGGQRGRGGLQAAADLQQLQPGVVLHQLDGEADALQQQVRLEAGDVRAVTAPDVEDAGGGERAHRLARGVAGKAQLGGQLVFRRQPGPGRELPGQDEVPDPGDSRLSERSGHGYSSLVLAEDWMFSITQNPCGQMIPPIREALAGGKVHQCERGRLSFQQTSDY
jgi:hypothetical protein